MSHKQILFHAAARELEDFEENLGAQMVRQAAERTGDSVGDGALRGVERGGRATSPTRVPHVCFAVFVVAWVALAIAPLDRTTWMLENLLTVVAVTSAVLTFRRFRFRDRAYVGATIFLLIHTLGSHYTYSATPLGELARVALGGSRNHYDRFAHFSFGVLLLPALRDLVFRPPAKAPLVRQLVVAVGMVAALGAAYEVLEWLTAIVVDPASGTAYLGTQGDEWDAQKDLLAAGAGGVVGALLEVHARLRGGRKRER